MQSLEPQVDPSRNGRGKGYVAAGLLLIVAISGCGGKSTTSTATQSQPGPPSYFAPAVIEGQSQPQTYTLDDTSGTFSQSFYPLAPQALNAGTLSIGQRGLRSLAIGVHYVSNNGTPVVYSPVTYNPPQSGSFAVELAGQTGALVQLAGQSPQPVVAATQCPALTTAQTYQFVTLPGALVAPGSAGTNGGWDATTETAYGSVDITSSGGGAVAFQNIQQFILPSAGGTGSPAQPGAAQATGTCASTLFGNTVAVPGQLVITDPSLPGGGGSTIPQASVGVGVSSGLLVEDNGSGAGAKQPGTSPALPYNNVLGAGTGAVGLPRPASALQTSSLVGAQYLGFIDAVGAYAGSGVVPAGSSQHLASFGFSTVPSSCATVTASTGTLIYGGDFTGDNPSASSDGFGNCDFAIDLGAQDAANNGLYPAATVWVGAAYAGNATHTTYSFPAVAVAGQIGGKFAVFLIGVDSTQPWSIYLLQSN